MDGMKQADKVAKHNRQHALWDDEHRTPLIFKFVDSTLPNPGVVEFWDWMKSRRGTHALRGLEICCGKGRNSIWLAGKGVSMFGFDFSEVAITEAMRRQEQLSLPERVHFRVHDAISLWPYSNQEFDFVIDCFGSSDIEPEEGRQNVLNEALRVLKPGGYYFLQIDSPEMGFFAERFNKTPGPERNTLLFPNGKVEAVLTELDIANWHHPLAIIEVRREIETTLEICGQTAPYKYFWIVAQAPNDCY